MGTKQEVKNRIKCVDPSCTKKEHQQQQLTWLTAEARNNHQSPRGANKTDESKTEGIPNFPRSPPEAVALLRPPWLTSVSSYANESSAIIGQARYFVSSGSILNAESIAIGTSEPKVATFAISVTISATSTARCPAGNKQQRCRQLDSGAGPEAWDHQSTSIFQSVPSAAATATPAAAATVQ